MAKRPENKPFFEAKIFPKNEILAKHCFFWLLMLYCKHSRLNGWGCPLGIETIRNAGFLQSFQRLNGWGCPLGIETLSIKIFQKQSQRLNGWGCPLGIETGFKNFDSEDHPLAKWLGMSVRN